MPGRRLFSERLVADSAVVFAKAHGELSPSADSMKGT